jgi:hypothetical protein
LLLAFNHPIGKKIKNTYGTLCFVKKGIAGEIIDELNMLGPGSLILQH